jgi:hypothetical protein
MVLDFRPNSGCLVTTRLRNCAAIQKLLFETLQMTGCARDKSESGGQSMEDAMCSQYQSDDAFAALCSHKRFVCTAVGEA